MSFNYATGLDWKRDLIEIATKFNFIQRPNNQTYVLVDLNTGEILTDVETGEELKFRGKQKMLDYLDTHVDFQNKYLTMVQEFISAPQASYGRLLDAREEKELDAQESSVNGNNDQTEEEFLREQEINKQSKDNE